MVKSMYAAVSGLRSHQSKMDVISNNISNVNTWGFKSQNTSFMDSMYQNYKVGSANNERNGGTNTSQIGFGSNVSSISVNYTTGAWSPTGNNLDCMVNGPAFFVVGSARLNPDGTVIEDTVGGFVGGVEAKEIAGSGLKLSRVGIFAVDSEGYLVDNNGNYIYGWQAQWGQNEEGKDELTVTSEEGTEPDITTKALTRIRIPSKDPALANAIDAERPTIQTYKIGDDGIIVGTDKDENIYTIGKVAVATPTNINGLEHLEGYYYTPGANAGVVTASEATTGTGKIISGYLEMSNVDLAKEMSDLITTQRGYQANTKIITVTDEMLSDLVNMKR